MVKLSPPIWTLICVLAAAAISWSLGWPKFLGQLNAALGISLVAVALFLMVWAVVVFRREGTEVNPTSPTTANWRHTARTGLAAILCTLASLP